MFYNMMLLIGNVKIQNLYGIIKVKKSKALQHKLTKKLEKLSLSERTLLVKNLFDIFKNNNITDAKEIKIKEIFKLIKEFNKLNKERQNLIN